MKTTTPMILALFGNTPIGFYFKVAIEPEITRIVISILVILMVGLRAWKPKGELNYGLWF